MERIRVDETSPLSSDTISRKYWQNFFNGVHDLLRLLNRHATPKYTTPGQEKTPFRPSSWTFHTLAIWSAKEKACQEFQLEE